MDQHNLWLRTGASTKKDTKQGFAINKPHLRALAEHLLTLGFTGEDGRAIDCIDAKGDANFKYFEALELRARELHHETSS